MKIYILQFDYQIRSTTPVYSPILIVIFILIVGTWPISWVLASMVGANARANLVAPFTLGVRTCMPKSESKFLNTTFVCISLFQQLLNNKKPNPTPLHHCDMCSIYIPSKFRAECGCMLNMLLPYFLWASTWQVRPARLEEQCSFSCTQVSSIPIFSLGSGIRRLSLNNSSHSSRNNCRRKCASDS